MIDRKIGKIKVLRGTDSQRKLIPFEEGELIYSIDKKLLFIGDGNEKGGILVSNKNYVKNSLGEPPIVPNEAQHGDLIFDKSSKRTYITKFNGLSYELILIADANCGAILQNEINDINSKLLVLLDCVMPRPTPIIPPDPSKLSWYTQPTDILINNGDTLTLTSSAAGGTGLVYYNWRKTSGSSIISTNKDLIISNIQIPDAGSYYCVSNNATDSITSRNAIVSIIPPPVIPPVIPPSPLIFSWYIQPTDILINIGDTLTLTSSAAGGGSGYVSYKWRKISDINIISSNKDLIITNAQITDADSYYCIASNSITSITSRNAIVYFNPPPVAPPNPPPLLWSREPAPNISIFLGDTITLTSSAVGGIGAISYNWRRVDKDPIPATTTDKDLIITNAKLDDFTTYYCVASNYTSAITSRNATVSFAKAPTVHPPSLTLVWDTEPFDTDVKFNEKAEFSASANGLGTITYLWKRRDGNIIKTSDSTLADISINNCEASDVATYYCIASNSTESITSRDATLNILGSIDTFILAEDGDFVLSELSDFINWETSSLNPPVIITQPRSLVTTSLVSVRFTITANGSAPISYQWRIGGVDIIGETGTSYTISKPTKDITDITCKVSNLIGNVVSSSVNLQMGIITSIVTQPTSQVVSIGSAATFTVVANGSGTISYQWKKNGSDISGATSNTYTISSVKSTDTGNYVCYISNTYGSITTNSVILAIK